MIHAPNQIPGLLLHFPTTYLGACLWDSILGHRGPAGQTQKAGIPSLKFHQCFVALIPSPSYHLVFWFSFSQHNSIECQDPEMFHLTTEAWGSPLFSSTYLFYFFPVHLALWSRWDHTFAFPLQDFTGLLVNCMKGLFWSIDLLEPTEHKRRLL